MKLTFWGAARTVTGSMHHVEAAGARFLLDCGLYQGRRQEAFDRNSHFPVPVSDILAVILAHAHIDHSGNREDAFAGKQRHTGKLTGERWRRRGGVGTG